MTFTLAGKAVGPVGFGMISVMTPAKSVSTDNAIKLLKAALNAGSNFWNAGLHYGTPEWNSLHLLREYFTRYAEDADKVCVCVKGGFDTATRTATADAAGIKAAIEEALRIAEGKFSIDVFEVARLDPDVPVEETMGAVGEYFKAGKIGGVGISECSAASVRKAAAVTPIALAELELSLFETTILQNGTAKACEEFGIPIIAYCPLGRGFLTGQVRRYEDLHENDFRRHLPRFAPENFGQNMKLVEDLEQVSKRKGCTAGQVALSWVAAQKKSSASWVMPIPGTSSVARLHENMKLVDLTKEDLQQIDEVLAKTEVKGGRYPESMAKYLNV